MKSYLRRLGVALLECAAILIVLSGFYIVSYLAWYQELPRWK